MVDSDENSNYTKTHSVSRKPSNKVLTRVLHIKIESSKILEANYVIGNKLGEGTFGVVVEACSKRDQSAWAIKMIRKDRNGGKTTSSKSWEREVCILQTVRHPNIISLRETFESERHVFLVMELCNGGNLKRELKIRQKFSEEGSRLIMSQLANAVSYLHRRNIVHRDLKLDNILIHHTLCSNGKKLVNLGSKIIHKNCSDQDLKVKLTDFGLSIELKKLGDTMLEFCGTPLYMAPEIVAGKSYSKQCDVWSLGIILYQLITGSIPFKANSQSDLYDQIRNLNATELTLTISSLRAKMCLKRLLHIDPAYRCSASELTVDPWISGHELTDGNSATNVLELMKQFHRKKHINEGIPDLCTIVEIKE